MGNLSYLSPDVFRSLFRSHTLVSVNTNSLWLSCIWSAIVFFTNAVKARVHEIFENIVWNMFTEQLGQ